MLTVCLSDRKDEPRSLIRLGGEGSGGFMKNGCLWTRRLLMVGITGMSSLVGAQALDERGAYAEGKGRASRRRYDPRPEDPEIKMAGGTNPDLPGCGAGGRHIEGIPALSIPHNA
jgi:hypothetical protein